MHTDYASPVPIMPEIPVQPEKPQNRHGDPIDDIPVLRRDDWFGLIQLHIVAVDAFSFITGLNEPVYSEGSMLEIITAQLLESFRELPTVTVTQTPLEIYCMWSAASEEAAVTLCQQVIIKLTDIEQDIHGIRFFMDVSRISRGSDTLPELRRAVQRLGEYRIFHLDTRPVIDESILSLPRTYNPDRRDIEKERQIQTLFRAGKFNDAAALFGSLFDDEYLVLAAPQMLLKHKCAQYLDSLICFSSELMGIDVGSEMEAFQPELRLMDAHTYAEIRAQMEHFFGHLNDLYLSRKLETSSSLILQIQNYVQLHYSDSALSVGLIADQLGKSTSYISRSYQEATGSRLLDYIHRYRIQEAKIRIGRGDSLADIASAVGYTNVQTMTRAFKRYEGTTPGKFKPGTPAIKN